MSHNREGNPIRAYHRTRVPHDDGANRPLVTVRELRPWQRDGTLVRDPLEAPSPHARRVALTHVRGRGRREE
jgi:hypothetical protein